jgi:hypothetical protein
MMKNYVTADKLQQELEVIGRLLTATKAEVGKCYDEIGRLRQDVVESGRRADKMADKLIEMALVNRGAYGEASVKARLSTLDPAPSFGNSDVEEPTDDEEWPPPGHVAMNVN